ncbi:MAG: Flp pilus assembly complex ATPase component TadA [Alcanivoracaceae bacterium]|nr:Flp pilus assembly complex ATPase component TadA [Alcanivoracaceae bacterium]
MANLAEEIHIEQSDDKAKNTKVAIGTLLFSQKLITSEQLKYALQKQKITEEKLGELLVRLGMITDSELAPILSMQMGLEYYKQHEIETPDAEVLAMFNQELCLRSKFLPIKRIGDRLMVIVGNANLAYVSQIVTKRSGLRPYLMMADFGKVANSIKYHYFFSNYPIENLVQKEITILKKDIDQVHNPDLLLDYILHLAVKRRTTDIHIQPDANSAHISFRVDGVLQPIVGMSKAVVRLVSSIKMRAKMDITEQRLPQDGSFATEVVETPYDVRVSTLSTEYGENVVLRLLPGGILVRDLSQLGFLPEDLETMKKMFSQPAGIVLLTGPTGSGKTTTLHAGLRAHGLSGKNILTIEDPIEYKLPVICQTQVNRKANYTFETAITHFLRHDPDVMLIGEIRDQETALAAMTAAETGHLVLSTLHVNSAISVIPRLKSLGINSQIIADSLIGVVSQRLLRKLCPHCTEAYTPEIDEWRKVSNNDNIGELKRGKGCHHCEGSGFFGRMPIYEILPISKALSNAIATDASREEISKIVEKNGLIDIRRMAKNRVLNGMTSVDEYMRIIGEELD